jgi:hypothetical protein
MAPFVLYAASLDAMCRKIGDRACVTPAGLPRTASTRNSLKKL